LHYSIEFYIVNLFSVAAKLADFPVPISWLMRNANSHVMDSYVSYVHFQH
jgi:hypothetical protein